MFETRSLEELFPEWEAMGAPLNTKVNQDKTYYLSNELNGHELPTWAVPNTLHNEGNYIISLGSLCRWMSNEAENLGVEIYPGFSASQAIFDEQNRVCGVITGDMGLDKNGKQKANFEPGIELRAKFTLFAEGARGHIGKQLINKFNLADDKTPQHYAIGFKELWEIPAEQHQQGLVVHGLGWPLASEATGEATSIIWKVTKLRLV